MGKDLNISRPKSDEFEYIDYPTSYKPLGPNEGRTGYFHVCKDGEAREPRKDLEVFNYEGTFNPISMPR